MERVILDSGALIAIERDPSAARLPDETDIAIAAVTAAELLVGVERADDRHRDRRHRLAEGVIERVEIIAYDLVIAREHAKLLAHTQSVGQPRGAHDLQIAATARAGGRTVITTDNSAFRDLPGVSYTVIKPG